jgi:hypothetical protein
MRADDRALAAALAPLVGAIDVTLMREANLRATGAGASPAEVARWLWDEIEKRKKTDKKTDLILRSARRARLEGWQRASLLSWFETPRSARLLTMRSEFDRVGAPISSDFYPPAPAP